LGLWVGGFFELGMWVFRDYLRQSLVVVPIKCAALDFLFELVLTGLPAVIPLGGSDYSTAPLWMFI